MVEESNPTLKQAKAVAHAQPDENTLQTLWAILTDHEMRPTGFHINQVSPEEAAAIVDVLMALSDGVDHLVKPHRAAEIMTGFELGYALARHDMGLK